MSAISYAFGAGAAAAGAAPPPAGAAPAAFSSAAFTAWPLNWRVGANSPSLCPIISGTIVDRRDHVFTTFFSFREFSPSTFSRRCPSTNGPFLSERAIASLLLYAAQPPPLGVPHLLKPAHRTGHTMGLRTERANEARTQRVRYAFHDHRPARLAQLVENRLGWRDHRS